MPGTVTHHWDLGGGHPVVHTMCQVQILNAEGSTTKARALLDSASSTSFITEFSTAPTLTMSTSLHESWYHQQFCNPTFLTWNGGSQHIKSLWKDSSSGGDSAAQGHHQSAFLSSPILSQMEAFVKYPSRWSRLWHPRECWSAPRSRCLQLYNASHPAVWPFGITVCFRNMFRLGTSWCHPQQLSQQLIELVGSLICLYCRYCSESRLALAGGMLGPL